MITELIYKLRGIDKWPITSATVTSIEEVSSGGRTGITQNVSFTYRPANSAIESGKLFIDSYASLYGVAPKDEFDLQYDPEDPSRYYCKEAKSLSADIRRTILIMGIAFALFVFVVQLFRL